MIETLLAWIAAFTFGSWAELKKARIAPPPKYGWFVLDLILVIWVVLAVVITYLNFHK